MKITINPTLDMQTLEWIPRPSYEIPDHEVTIRFDRAAQGQAKQNVNTSNSVAGAAGNNAAQIGSSLIPGLERQANNPTGFTPVHKNRMLVAGGEAIGGVNSGLRGEANLASSRTRNAGGFTAALDEAARVKSRALGGNALNVENEDARQAQSNQRFAQGQLQGLYGLDTSNQLKAMGLSDEAVNSEVNAGKSGWLQNTLDTIKTLTGGAKDARSAYDG